MLNGDMVSLRSFPHNLNWLHSRSLSKKPGLLDPLPLRRTSSPSISRLTSPQTSKLVDTKQVPRLNSPKRIPSRTDSGAVSASLRQPLEMELVKADGFDEYLVDVNKKFSDLRTEFKGMWIVNMLMFLTIHII